jgi:hypothetical protein
MKNRHKTKRFANNSVRLPVEERSSVDFARAATLLQNVHTRTAFPSSTRAMPVRLNIADRRVVRSAHVFVDAPPSQDDAPPTEGLTTNTSGKYVPPSMRGGPGGRGPGESMRGNRDDLPTLRVTNISEDTQEQDLRDLFSYVGRVARVYVGRDRETGAGRGFAFVSFEDKETAQRAIDRMNGRGYDNLILNVGWSREFLFSHRTCFVVIEPTFYRTSGTALVYGRCHIRCTVIDACYVDVLSQQNSMGSGWSSPASSVNTHLR